jgi:hypothetical protein
MADEIGNVIANWSLPSETQAMESVSAQSLPDDSFSIC